MNEAYGVAANVGATILVSYHVVKCLQLTYSFTWKLASEWVAETGPISCTSAYMLLILTHYLLGNFNKIFEK